MNAEHAALVGLLQTWPRNLTWRELTEEAGQAEVHAMLGATSNPIS